MTCTSAEAAKLLSKLNEERSLLARFENQSRTFLASVGEDVESVRPAYDYEKTRDELKALDKKIRAVKHAINVFNATAVIPDFGMTIDEMLVYLPQLSDRKRTLGIMAAALPKTREPIKSNIIDYTYVNYDLETVKSDLEAVTDELSRAHIALDAVNHSATFEIEL